MESLSREPLAVTGNTVSTPLYFDRQILRAEDLSLDRRSRDAELERLRAMLHGWGAVAGLVPRLEGDTVVISPGYGVLPGGAELYLPDPLAITGVLQALLGHCGTGVESCELPTDGLDGAAPGGPLTGWLIVRRHFGTAEPRPGVPDGCRHPANELHPTRQCHQVAVELHCTLPEAHLPRPPACAELSPYVCGDPAEPVEMPAPLKQEEDFLVLGRLVLENEVLALSLIGRKALLPNSVLQQWLQSCICPLLAQEPEPVDWQELLKRIQSAGLDKPNNPDRPDAVLAMYEVPIVIGGQRSMVLLLIRGGINGPAEFLKAKSDTIALASGMTPAQIKRVAIELRKLAELFTA